MLLEFEKKLAGFIDANDLLGSAKKILLAVSGGADSTALMYAMHALKTENIIKTELLCAHINHRLRGTEGDLDEEFVVTRAGQLKLAVTTRQINVREFARLHKLSIETAARQLRMKALIDIVKANNCNRVVTAHQKNDNAETILHRLSRGTGFRGLGGIWPVRTFADQIKFVRPLLCFRRDEIIKYLQYRNLKWRYDHTNADCTYRRNHIRHRLIPILQKDCSSSVVEQLSQLARSAHAYYGIICSRADEVWPRLVNSEQKETVLDSKLLTNESQPVKVELIRRSLANISCGERYMTHGHYERILQLAEQNVTGRKIELPSGFVVRKEYENLIFLNRRVGPAPSEIEWVAPPRSYRPAKNQDVTVEIPGQTTFENFLIQATVLKRNEVDFEKFKAAKTDSVEWFDVDKIELPLTVRCRHAGDRFVPLGQTREKKLGKFLTAQRVPHRIRKDILVFADSEKIIWVWPVRMTEQSKITDQTQKILQLQITNLNT